MRLTGTLLHLALGIERHVQLTQQISILPGLHDTDPPPHGILDLRWILTFGVKPQLAKTRTQQRVGITTHDHIHPVQARRQSLIGLIAIVSQQNDLIYPLAGELIDIALGALRLIQKAVEASGLEEFLVLAAVTRPMIPT